MNTTYQANIIARFLTEKQMQDFHEEYCAARKISPTFKPSQQDIKIANEYKRGKTTRELSQRYKMTQSKITTRIQRVAKYFYMTS